MLVYQRVTQTPQCSFRPALRAAAVCEKQFKICSRRRRHQDCLVDVSRIHHVTPKIHPHAVEVAQAKSGTAIEAVPWRKTSEVLGIKGWVWLDFASWSNDYSKHVWFLRRPSLCLG
jgi:hypothetical protein